MEVINPSIRRFRILAFFADLYQALKFIYYSRHFAPYMTCIEQISKFVEEVQKTGKPKAMKMVAALQSDSEIQMPYVCLWACTGEGNPVDRIQVIGEQNLRLTMLLEAAYIQLPEGSLKEKIQVVLSRL